MEPFIRISQISKSFNPKKEEMVFNQFSLDIEKNELLVLFGPNGCGKSTLLHMLAGLTPPDKGNISIGNQPPSKTKVGIVFQNYSDSVFPWRTVKENIGLGFEAKRTPPTEEKTNEILKPFNLLQHQHKFPHQLSGGLKQLTAISRAIAYDPEVFLLDEPFSALDYQHTRIVWVEFLHLLSKLNKTAILISHDVDEAIFLADRVVILSNPPAKIVDIISIEFSKPRNLGLMQSNKSFQYRNSILRSFEKGLK